MGGPNLVINVDGLNLDEFLDYTPYGGIRINQKVHQVNPSSQRQYAGTEYDASTGLNYMRARYYNSGTGRFLSQDPVFISYSGKTLAMMLVDPQLANAYSYARGNPVMMVDRDGNMARIAIPLILFGLFTPNPANAPDINSELTPGITPTEWFKGGLRVMPVSGDAIDAYEASNGKDFVSGEKISGLMRSVTMAGAVTPLAPAYLGRKSIASALKWMGRLNPETVVKRMNGGIMLKVGEIWGSNKGWGLKHIVDKHMFGSGARNASQFLQGMDESQISRLIENTINTKQVNWVLDGNNYIATVDVGKIIGTTPSGTNTSILKLVLSPSDNSITSAFPY